jgi:hypothetical protein
VEGFTAFRNPFQDMCIHGVGDARQTAEGMRSPTCPACGEVLGLCEECWCVRWLETVTSRNGVPRGVCRSCAREPVTLADEPFTSYEADPQKYL